MPEDVGLFHMKSSYEEHSDVVKFLYKFIPGVAPQSFGIYVAKMAGINVSFKVDRVIIFGCIESCIRDS